MKSRCFDAEVLSGSFHAGFADVASSKGSIFGWGMVAVSQPEMLNSKNVEEKLREGRQELWLNAGNFHFPAWWYCSVNL